MRVIAGLEDSVHGGVNTSETTLPTRGGFFSDVGGGQCREW